MGRIRSVFLCTKLNKRFERKVIKLKKQQQHEFKKLYVFHFFFLAMVVFRRKNISSKHTTSSFHRGVMNGYLVSSKQALKTLKKKLILRSENSFYVKSGSAIRPVFAVHFCCNFKRTLQRDKKSLICYETGSICHSGFR